MGCPQKPLAPAFPDTPRLTFLGRTCSPPLSPRDPGERGRPACWGPGTGTTSPAWQAPGSWVEWHSATQVEAAVPPGCPVLFPRPRLSVSLPTLVRESPFHLGPPGQPLVTHLACAWHLGVLGVDSRPRLACPPPSVNCYHYLFPCLQLFPKSEASGGHTRPRAQHTVGAPGKMLTDGMSDRLLHLPTGHFAILPAPRFC